MYFGMTQSTKGHWGEGVPCNFVAALTHLSPNPTLNPDLVIIFKIMHYTKIF
jgi:hypothetical protein